MWIAPALAGIAAWFSTATGIAISSSVLSIGLWYVIGDAMKETSANIFGDSEDEDHKQNSELIALAVVIFSVGYAVSKFSKMKL